MLTPQARFRAEWVIMIGFLLVMSGFLVVLNQREYLQIEQRELEFLEQQAQSIERNLVLRVRAADRILLGLKEDLPGWWGTPDGIASANQRMRQITESVGGLRSMTWMDAKGIARTSSHGDLVGRDLSGQSMFRQVAAAPNSQLLYLTPPFKSVWGSFSVALARVVTGADGAFQGMLVSVLDPEYFRTLLESVNPIPDARGFIVHGNGNLFMMSPENAELSGRSLLSAESIFGQFHTSGALAMVSSGRSGIFGDQRMVAIRRVPHFEMSTDNDLVVMVSRGRAAVFASWVREYQVEAGALAAFATFSVLGLFFYQRRMRFAFDGARAEAQQRELAMEGHQRIAAQMAAAFTSMSDAVLLADTKGQAIDFNDAFVKFLRYGSKQECAIGLADVREGLEIQTLAGDVLPPDLRPVKRALNGESATSVLCRLRRKDTGEVWVAAYSFAPVRNEQGVIIGAVLASRDITQQMDEQLALVQALKDKDALLKEVHHRVKNNLQIVASLLRLERQRSTHPGTLDALATMQGRIRSMAVLHGLLYRSGTLAALDLGAYLGEVGNQAFKAHLLETQHVALVLNLASVEVGMDQATPCGLLVNELISNALKHAFAPGTHGEIQILLRPGDEADFWRVQVSDNGVGLMPGFEEKRGASMGLQLASELAMQMGGLLATSSTPGQGVTFEVRFKVIRPVPLVMPAL